MTDRFPGRGPLEGIAVALLASKTPLTLIIPVDLPFLTPELLYAIAQDAGTNGLIVTDPGGLNPLVGAYPSIAGVVALELVDSGKRSAMAIANALGSSTLSLKEVSAYGDPQVLFYNVNTREDLETTGRLATIRHPEVRPRRSA